LAFHIKWRNLMTKLKLLPAALVAAAMLATPAMARVSHVTSGHRAEHANASTTPGARHIGKGDGFRGNHFGDRFGGTSGDGYGGYGGRDMWGQWGTYYGPMI
jgi:hypothetical protein